MDLQKYRDKIPQPLLHALVLLLRLLGLAVRACIIVCSYRFKIYRKNTRAEVQALDPPPPAYSSTSGRALQHTGTSAVDPSPTQSEQRMQNVEKAIGFPFINRSLLQDALTHRSFLNEPRGRGQSNERLEFLGDAILSLITTDFLYHRFPTMPEGELTSLRAALVRTDSLAHFAQQLDLGNNLFLSRGEELSQGRKRPSVLASAFEALLGAIYLDRGYDVARDFALRFIEPTLQEVLEQGLHRNSKSMLQEFIQAHEQRTPSYHVVEESGPDHNKWFTVEVRVGERTLGQGSAGSKRAAEQMAAEDALRRINALLSNAEAAEDAVE
jgi:ribonuclease-3